MKNLLLVFVLNTILFASSGMPTVFIGTFNDSNKDTYKNLILPNIVNKEDVKWGLTHLTEELLETKFKHKFNNNFNIVTKKYFDKNLKKITNRTDVEIEDKKIGFFNIETYQNIETYSSGEKDIIVTLNLTFSQIGKEANRENKDNAFEVRYTNGITVNGIIDISPADKNPKEKIYKYYKSFYTETLSKLIDLIVLDTNSKKVTEWKSDDIFFTLGKVRVGKKVKIFANKIYKNEQLAKEQLTMMVQENLIKSIRQNNKLDDIVLLYPDFLNKKIFDNWSDYLKRIDKNSNDANIKIRKIKPVCKKLEDYGSDVYVNGYSLEVMITELYDKILETADLDSIHGVKSSMVSRIILKLRDKQKVDATSVPGNIIKKKKRFVGQASDSYDFRNSLVTVKKNKVLKTIRKSIDNLMPKLIFRINEIVDKRKQMKEFFYYENLCEE